MRIVRWLPGLLALSFGSLVFAKVSVDFDHKADFTKYKTYAWMEGKGTAAPNPLTEKRIRRNIEAQLEAKGLKKTEGEADLQVVTHASADVRVAVDGGTFTYGGYYEWDGWSYWGPTATVHLQDMEVGMLLVDLVDSRSGELVWRGVATETLGSVPDPENVRSKIDKVTRKMFKQFPPEVEKE